MYLAKPVLQAHGISLQLTESTLGHMAGSMRLDPNTCSLDLWGDRAGCTKLAPQNQPVEATAMRTLDPQGHHRINWRFDINGAPGARVALVEYPSANLWYLSVTTERDGMSVVPLFDAKLFAQDVANPGGEARPPHDATEYHLHGDGTDVVFHRGNDDEMRLQYNGKVFSGRELHRELTVLGLTASALVEASPDLHTIWFTVVIPDARCPANARSIPVTTFAVLTTKRTSIAGPAGVAGQIEVYKVVCPLTGNAW